MIRVSNLRVMFGAVVALQLEEFEIAAGDRVAIVGSNGTGKSTLLRVLAGLIDPTEGTISSDFGEGRAVLVHQHPYLFQGTVEQNIAYAIDLTGGRREDAPSWLERVGARDLAAREASGLSGGERRRVAIARALCTRPQLLLLDEPFAGLDLEGRQQVETTLEEFAGALVIAGPEVDPQLVQRIVRLDNR